MRGENTRQVVTPDVMGKVRRPDLTDIKRGRALADTMPLGFGNKRKSSRFKSHSTIIV